MLIFNKFDLTDFLQGVFAGMGATAVVMIILVLVAAWRTRKPKGARAGPDSDGKKNDSDDK
jgi:hypothetical protein